MYHSSLSIGLGGTADLYAQTVSDSDNSARTPAHRVIVQNRSGQVLDLLSGDYLSASPPVGFKLSDGADATFDLDGQFRLWAANRTEVVLGDIHVTVVLV